MVYDILLLILSRFKFQKKKYIFWLNYSRSIYIFLWILFFTILEQSTQRQCTQLTSESKIVPTFPFFNRVFVNCQFTVIFHNLFDLCPHVLNSQFSINESDSSLSCCFVLDSKLKPPMSSPYTLTITSSRTSSKKDDFILTTIGVTRLVVFLLWCVVFVRVIIDEWWMEIR